MHIYCAPYLLRPLNLVTRVMVVSADRKAPRFLLFPVTSSLLHPSISVSTSFVKVLFGPTVYIRCVGKVQSLLQPRCEVHVSYHHVDERFCWNGLLKCCRLT
jgi:hypothetical protein